MRHFTARAGLGLLATVLSAGACTDENNLGTTGNGMGGQDDGQGTGGQIFVAPGTGGALSGPDPADLKEPSIIEGPIEKVDVLFVIDNSVGMGDKYRILAQSVPRFLNDMVSASCITGDRQRIEPVDGECPEGQILIPDPIDLHVGVITSSLGDHGANTCPADDPNKNNDDRGRLLPSVRDDVDEEGDPQGTGFISWSSDGELSTDGLIGAVQEQIKRVGQKGCGFEAPLEAWYRFLVDPNPPREIEVDDDGRAQMKGIDEKLLEQRAAFLRPDSMVSIVVLSDEDDCSIMDGGEYYDFASFGYVTSAIEVNQAAFNMPIATEICAENPNDECCLSCLQKNNVPEGCETAVEVCEPNPTPALTREFDHPNLRCSQQKKRFGIDLLYPTERYVNALTQTRIIDARTGTAAYNPLLVDPNDTSRARDPSRVILTGIVGVPWQDVATEESLDLESETLELLDISQLSRENVETDEGMVSRWDLMLGTPGLPMSSLQCANDGPGCGDVPIPPLDPFMVVSSEPRKAGQKHPLTGDEIVAASSEDPLANAINGHEADHTVRENTVNFDDLQHACIYERKNPHPCAEDDASCDCAYEPSRNRAVCQPPEGGGAEAEQYFEGAYPAPRILEVLKGVGHNAVAASACPKNLLADVEDPNHGYNPAFDSLSFRLGLKIRNSLE